MAAAWINEFHYDDDGTDSGEFIEIAAAAGTSLAGWSLVLYNGNPTQRNTYSTVALSGVIPDQQNGFGTLSFAYPVNGIQNGGSGASGEPDGIALVNNLGQVVEFISYEGVFTAVNGPAAGMTSTNVGAGVFEPGTANGTSIGRIGTGDEAADFTWAVIGDDTPAGVNSGQTFGTIVMDKPGAFSIADAVVIEGNSGSTPITFTVTRGTDSNVAASVSYTVTLPGGATGASADDFVAPTLSGTLNFAANEFSKTITLNVAGDGVNEADETFTVTLSSPTNGATLADAGATGTIQNDDAFIVPGAPFINEIHYDNAGTDAGEAIEIAAPAGTNLAGWSIVLYSVSTGATTGTVYNTRILSGIVPDQDDGYGTITFTYPVNGIQNGPQDGLALVDPDGNVVQFLSYEGAFVAANGPAAGLTSTDLGVFEDSGSATGFSLQLVGSGASAADFTWTSARDDNFGAVNTDQDFIGPNATGQVRVSDSSVAEGDSGVTMLVFTVSRAGGLGQAASVDWMLNLPLGGADLLDFAPGQPLSGHVDFAPGVSSVQIAIAVRGDTIAEGNETFSLILANPVGNIAIADASGTGTILNDDPIALTISQIQGEGHATAYAGQPVTTTGIVTGVVANGFYLQDPAGDFNSRTSDAIFVFTDTAPTVAVGDSVVVRGTPEEFVPAPGSLSITELVATNANVLVLTHGNVLPDAVVIGVGGRQPPTEVIEDDGFTSYDPATDGLDFYESMEGMRVTIDAPTVVSNTSSFGETWVLASGGAGATGYNGTGITVSEGDFNPERIQIDATSALFAGYVPNHSMGDMLADVTGILSYSFNSYEVLVTEAVTVVADVTAERETTSLTGDRDHLTIASYNVENLDPTDGPVKFDLLAQNIVYNLAAPDIIALQEIQDANGLNGSDPLSGEETAQLLIDAIAALGGPNYVYVEIAPSTAGSTGGEPGGNIRNGFLYNADRVSYIVGSATLIDGPAFNGSRKPLAADFMFNGETVRLVNVHFTSRIGSDPLMGANQPPSDAGDGSRTAQAEAVRAFVNDSLATNPSLKLGVMGDFNGFYFENAIAALEAGGVLTDLHRLNSSEERYSYLFDGNLQAIDHMLVDGGLAAGGMFDAVHINAEQPAGAERGTDHDPIVGRFFIEHPNEAPADLVLDGDSVDENAPAGTLVGTVSAEDPDPEDVLSYTLVDDAGGLFALDAATGALTTTAPLDHEAEASYDLVIRATDPDGLSVERTVTITIGDVNEAPTAAADAVAVDEDGTTANLWSLLLGNDSDPDAGTTLAIESVNGTGTLGSLVFDPDSQSLRYVADHDSFDALAPGQSVVDTFTYTVTDADGLTSTATVSVTVTGIADGAAVNGGNGNDVLNGGAGEDVLDGGNGNDVVNGQGGHDLINGGNGADTLNGGSGNDILIGGNGNDSLFGGDGRDVLAGGNGNDLLNGGAGADFFQFGKGGGTDTVADFEAGVDRIALEEGIGLAGSQVGDVNGDGILDLTLAFTNGGGSAVLLGVSDLGSVGFAPAQDLSNPTLLF